MKRLLTVLMVIGLLGSMAPATFAFDDQPAEEHWVYDNFQLLYEAGLLQGYPDSSFQGQQAATRYELVELTARALKYMEDQMDVTLTEKKYLTEEEAKALISETLEGSEQIDAVYDAIRDLEEEFKGELDKTNAKVTTLEEGLNSQIEDLQGQVKTAKILGIVGIAVGILAGIVAFAR